jgi:hypothetical protein
MSDKILKKILWASIEDYCGLWEIVWETNSFQPQNTIEQNHEIALNITNDLLVKNMINLFFCQEPYGKLTLIEDRKKCTKILQNNDFWKEPSASSISVRVSATSKGREWYLNSSNNEFLEL